MLSVRRIQMQSLAVVVVGLAWLHFPSKAVAEESSGGCVACFWGSDCSEDNDDACDGQCGPGGWVATGECSTGIPGGVTCPKGGVYDSVISCMLPD